MNEEKTKVRVKTIRLICGIVWGILCGLMALIAGFIAGANAGPKVIKAKQIWDELTEDESEDDEWTEW